MTIRWYTTAAELTGAGKATRKAARFEMLLGFRRDPNGKRQMKKVGFCVTGDTDAAVEKHGITIGELIAKFSLAKIMKFSKVLGHYRTDEECPVIAGNRKMMGVVRYSTEKAHADGLEAINLKLLVPFFDSGTYAAGELETLILPAIYGSDTACIGMVRWEDQNQSALQTLGDVSYEGFQIVDETYIKDEHLVSDNVADGIADGVLGPAF